MDNELDLSHVNEIDMECNVDPDDDGFGGVQIKVDKPNLIATVVKDEVREGSEERDYVAKTGIILDFSDDDSKPMKVISANVTPEGGIDIQRNFQSEQPEDYSGCNDIDMECSVGEDDDFVPAKVNQQKLDFGDDEEEVIPFESKELVLEDKSDGTVNKDYWKDLASKHKKTNKKGAYNTHFHLSGNPEEEMKMFNHDMGSDVSAADGSVGEVASVSSAGGDAGGGMGEGLKKNPQYVSQFKDLLNLMDYDLEKVNGKIVLVDRVCDIIVDDIDSMEGLVHNLYKCGVEDYLEVDDSYRSALDHAKDINLKDLL